MKRFYETLLKFYPSGYRTRFAGEMAATFERAAAGRRARGAWHFLRFALVEFVGLGRGIANEWLVRLSLNSQ